MTARLPRMASCVAMALAAMACQTASAIAPQQTPRDDNEIVEVLRERPLPAEEREWRALRQRARQAPADLALATQVARQALAWARRDGDPRLLGQAQGALRHWWHMPSPPLPVRLLRATIRQSRHEFGPALAELEAIVQADPMQAQAWLTLAAVRQVTGRHDDAQAACEGLARARAVWLSRLCLAELDSVRGQPEAAEQSLRALAVQAPPELATHLLLVRAELAARLGQPDAAARLFKLRLAHDEADAYALGAYADLLLDQAQPAQALALLQGRERNDALLLRMAEAHKALGQPAAEAAIRTLKARFAAARARGDQVHLREEARFALRLLRQPAQALALAQRNWQVQKEPADARILIEAARAAGQPQAATPASSFMQQAGWAERPRPSPSSLAPSAGAGS